MKTTILLILILVIGTTLSAQISVGLSVGNNVSKVKSGADYKNYPDLIKPFDEAMFYTNGLFAGIPVEVGFTNRLSLFTTFSYFQKGTRGRGALSFTGYDTVKSRATTKFNYLELPIQAKFYLSKNKLKAFCLAGPSIGYLISVRNKLKSTNYDSRNDETTYLNWDYLLKSKELKNSAYHRVDVSFVVGVGCESKVGIGKLFLNINYNYGLTDMLRHGDGFAKGTYQYNRGFTTAIGYLIPLTE